MGSAAIAAVDVDAERHAAVYEVRIGREHFIEAVWRPCVWFQEGFARLSVTDLFIISATSLRAWNWLWPAL